MQSVQGVESFVAYFPQCQSRLPSRTLFSSVSQRKPGRPQGSGDSMQAARLADPGRLGMNRSYMSHPSYPDMSYDASSQAVCIPVQVLRQYMQGC